MRSSARVAVSAQGAAPEPEESCIRKMQDSRWVARRRVAHARIREEAGPSDRSLTARVGRRRGRSRSWRDARPATVAGTGPRLVATRVLAPTVEPSVVLPPVHRCEQPRGACGDFRFDQIVRRNLGRLLPPALPRRARQRGRGWLPRSSSRCSSPVFLPDWRRRLPGTGMLRNGSCRGLACRSVELHLSGEAARRSSPLGRCPRCAACARPVRLGR